MPDKNGDDYRDCEFCNDVVAYGVEQRHHDGKLFHVDCLIRKLKDEIHKLENPRSLENLTLDEAKAVAQAAATRLANCTFKEVVNDVWAAAVNKIIQDEHVAFLTWLAQVKDLYICRLYEDERQLLVAEETRNDLIDEYTIYRKKD